MPVTSSALAGTVESYTAYIDGNASSPLRGIRWSRSIQNSGVGIGTTTLAERSLRFWRFLRYRYGRYRYEYTVLTTTAIFLP